LAVGVKINCLSAIADASAKIGTLRCTECSVAQTDLGGPYLAVEAAVSSLNSAALPSDAARLLIACTPPDTSQSYNHVAQSVIALPCSTSWQNLDTEGRAHTKYGMQQSGTEQVHSQPVRCVLGVNWYHRVRIAHQGLSVRAMQAM
jgi:hypothetical protein